MSVKNKTIVYDTLCAGQAETEAVAKCLANVLKAGDLVALTGDLGAGKTTFSRALIRAAQGDAEAEVPSPTFTLVQTYDTDHFEIYHADLYRLKDPDDVYDLGIEDEREQAVFLVEWPDRMPDEWWQGALELKLLHAGEKLDANGDDEARKVQLLGDPAIWQSRLIGVMP